MSACPAQTASIYSPVNGEDCGSQTSSAASKDAPTLRRQLPGSENISSVRRARENQARKNLSPAASRSDLQVSAPSSKLGGAREPACALPRARGCGGSRIRISCTCAIARALGLRVTHTQSGGRLHINQQAGPTSAAQHLTPVAPLSHPSPQPLAIAEELEMPTMARPLSGGERTEITYGMCWHVTGVEGQEKCNIASPSPIHLWSLQPRIYTQLILPWLKHTARTMPLQPCINLQGRMIY